MSLAGFEKSSALVVMPAKAGIQARVREMSRLPAWIPAFAGLTKAAMVECVTASSAGVTRRRR